MEHRVTDDQIEYILDYLNRQEYITADQVREIINRAVDATDHAYGPAGMVALGLLTALVMFLFVGLSTVWFSWRKDRKLMDKIREGQKEELKDNIKVLSAFSNLLEAVHAGQLDLGAFVQQLSTAIIDAERRIIKKLNDMGGV